MKFASTNFELQVEEELGELVYKKENDWANYLIGVVKDYRALGHALGGFEILLDGNIPNGAGLSSSASVELLMCVTLNGLFGAEVSPVERALLSQRVENNFIGVNSGIMDQYIISLGKKDCAIFLNCAKLEHQYVPFKLDGAKIVIGNTNKRRGLADSKYNERRAECEKSVEYLQKELKASCLGEISVEEFERCKGLIPDPIIAKRAEHVVYEDHRCREAVRKLEAGDVAGFGQLMNQSHISLRDLYEVTGVELDTMVEEAWKADGVIGSRMTGAGFGGCTVSLVKSDYVDKFIQTVGEGYKARTGLTADFYIAEVGDGATAL